ncbi:MAG: hypothetical protein KME25_30450 [Symplocastrum torsivum CPER-KK1]|uniref:Uncharacterized protein n=1 Tax=Symplocastrum torsivum CPER-KK1 TaxID=450513 RepID=A0A951PU01_9CYAN|nr:hypothetical protein [Symplocastrum torsivum CPER-KK1]
MPEYVRVVTRRITCLAPLITDAPIIIAALWFLSQFNSIELFLPILGEAASADTLWEAY